MFKLKSKYLKTKKTHIKYLKLKRLKMKEWISEDHLFYIVAIFP